MFIITQGLLSPFAVTQGYGAVTAAVPAEQVFSADDWRFRYAVQARRQREQLDRLLEQQRIAAMLNDDDELLMIVAQL